MNVGLKYMCICSTVVSITLIWHCPIKMDRIYKRSRSHCMEIHTATIEGGAGRGEEGLGYWI